jgi:hypothetical protein
MRSVGERGMYSGGWMASSMVLVLTPSASLAVGVDDLEVGRVQIAAVEQGEQAHA